MSSGSTVTAVIESSNNHSLAYDDTGGEEFKRVCQEQAVDLVIVGFIEQIDETSWPSYSISYMNCGSGTSSSNSYNLDKDKNDKHRFERAVKRGLKDFWRYSVSAELQ